MSHLLRTFSLLAAIVFVLSWETPALAQQTADSFPEINLNPGGRDPNTILRGPGGYLGPYKLLACWLLLALWVKTTDWLSRDCLQLRMNYALWNSVVFFTFIAGFLLVWMIPIFPLGYALLLGCYFGPLGAYIYVRNQALDPHLRVLTPEHFRFMIANLVSSAGIKMDAEKKLAYQKGAPVEVAALGGAGEQANQANLITARQSPGFLPMKEILADAIGRRADAFMLDYTAEAVGVRYQIDGMWHAIDPRDRESGDLMLAVMKTLVAGDAGERRKRQAGMFQAKFAGTKYLCRLTSQGTESGERAVVKLDTQGPPLRSWEQLGMRDKMREQLAEVMGRESGLVLFSSLPQGGQTTTINASLLETDRLLRDFVAIEDVNAREKELENVDVTTFDPKAGQTPATVLPKVIRAYPNVIVVRDLADPETVGILCDQVQEKRLMIGSIRAGDAAEALLRVLMLKVPPQKFAPAITASLNQRLIRKLCTHCRVGYEPTEDVLKSMGLPAGRIQTLYREPKPEERDKPCAHCQALGYLGRTSIFELLVVDAKVRELLARQPKLDLIKKAAKAAGSRSLQEEGILLVAKGVTSLSELLRVLKTNGS